MIQNRRIEDQIGIRIGDQFIFLLAQTLIKVNTRQPVI